MNKKWMGLFLLPGLLLLVIFLVIPLFSTLGSSFIVDGKFTLARYQAFLSDEYYREIYFRTIRLGLITTLIAGLMGFPTAYYISRRDKKVRGLYIMFAVFPLLTSAVVRSFSWMVILGKRGVVNTLLLRSGLIAKPLSLLYNEISIVIGLVYLFMPLMIMSLVGVMENIEGDLTEAAESLGASRTQAFFKVIFPLSVPGLIIGSILVFTGSITAYTTPQLLGGSQAKVLSTLIYQSAMALFDWDTAAVVATIMIVTTMIVSTIINKLAARINRARG